MPRTHQKRAIPISAPSRNRNDTVIRKGGDEDLRLINPDLPHVEMGVTQFLFDEETR